MGGTQYQATIQRYALAVDSGRFELFDETFTADAELDYRSAGGPNEGREKWVDGPGVDVLLPDPSRAG